MLIQTTKPQTKSEPELRSRPKPTSLLMETPVRSGQSVVFAGAT